MEEQELQDDANALLPIITAVLAAGATYGATQRYTAAHASTLAVAAQASAALYSTALRLLMATVKKMRTVASRDILMGVVEEAARRAARDGEAVVVRAAVEAAADAAQVAHPGAKVKVSKPGKPFPGTPTPEDTPDPSPLIKPEIVARQAAQTVRNAARQYVAELAPELKLRKSWHSHKDSRVRASHAFLGDKTYESHTVGILDTFTSITGATLRFPGDPLAPIYETARCRCWITIHS